MSMLEWTSITGCYKVEMPEHLKFYTTQKSQLFVNILNTVYSRFSMEMVGRVGADTWETRKIQNLYFIAPRTKNQTVIYLLYR
jgi:predicted small integral membrane protein